MTRRELLAGSLGPPAILHAQKLGHPVSRIERIDHKGVWIRDCSLPGETRRDDCVPAHPNGIPASRDKWLIVYATRKFRGVDDDASIVYQLRAGAPDGKLIREGMISQSIDNWDPFGDGKETFIRQHGHPVAFGVPKGAVIQGRPAPNANVFAVKWRVTAKVLDRQNNALVRSAHDREVSEHTQNVEWMQCRLNHAEDDIEILQPRTTLRQKGFESGEVFCSLPDSGKINETFVQAVPASQDCSEWADACHFGVGKVAALKYRFNGKRGVYEWVETGPSLFDVPASEASLVRYGDRWLVAGRTTKKAIAWVATDDPFRKTGKTVLPPSPAASSPLCAYRRPDGVLSVFTGDASVSPQHKDRDPMYCWEIDPDDQFKVMDRRTIYNTVAAGLPIRPGASPKVDMCKLLPHSGATQYIVHRVSIRAFNHPYVGNDGTVLKDIPIANQQEKDVCAIYYAKVTYKEAYPSAWEFVRA
jgi:hypothetical protein